MAIDILTDFNFNGVSKILNLPNGVEDTDPATLGQLKAAIEGLAWKDNVKVASVSNINLTSPGATIDGVAMVAGDRFLAKDQTTASQNGIYVWSGASTPATRALDANSTAELESAVTTVDQGSSAGTTFRQTQTGFTLDTGSVVWASFGTAAPVASDTTAGIIEIATQLEVDTGTDNLKAVTPKTLSDWSGRINKYETSVGDGSATSFTVTHNLGTRDVRVDVYRNSGNYDTVLAEVRRPTVDTVQVLFSTAPTSGQYRVVVVG